MTVAAAEVPVRAAGAGVRAAVYCRISHDPDGTNLGVARQREDCLALAAARGWTVDPADIFIDNDVSAYSGRARPRYAALLDGVCSGVFGAVVAWHPDRLHRSPKELETFIEAVEAHAVTVETVRAGRHDFTTANGRLMARLTGAVARAESEQKSERVTRALAQRAAQGRPHGAVRYGWRRVYAATGYHDEVAPDQAAIVREVAARIVAGDSLRAIATDLGRRGVPTPQRSRVDRKTGAVVPVSWTPMTVRGLVLRATNVALRVHGGAVVGNGDWPPILDRGVWEQVKAILADPARKTSTGTVAKHLLSGIARCGVCGGPMRVALRTYGGGGHGKHANRPRCSRRLSPSRLRSRSWNPPSPTPRRHERRSTGRTWRAWTIGTRSRTYEGIKHVDMVPILSPDRSPSTLIQRGLHTMRRGDCARGEPSAPGSWPRGT